jgi:hypothetical protein
MSRIYASDLLHDGRWPIFVTAVQLEALLRLIRGDVLTEQDTDLVHAALTWPERRHTNNAKRLYWELPEDAIMVRVTHGERHALKTMLSGIGVVALRETEEIQGLKKHLMNKASRFRKAVRA